MRNVLVVDDCGIMRDVLGMTLRRAGFNVLPASGGRSALEIARSRRLDAVLADVNMPEMDGLAMLRDLRQMPQHIATPVIVLSSHDDPARREEGLRLGATTWLTKPFTPEAIVRVLRALTMRATEMQAAVS
ncbi:MAG TPA: response regulator [Nevskiaceae bacterium]|nr:response regulator [Nevskiaceae bacterium]